MTTWQPKVPSHWRVSTIGDETQTKLGRMLNSEARSGSNQVPYLRNENVRWGGFDLRDINTMSIPPEKQADYLLEPGDILVCEGGDIGRAAVWVGTGTPMYFQKALHRIRVGVDVDAAFLRYWLEHLAVSGRLLPYATGSTISHLPQQALRRLPLVVPPLAEQQAIVETIERMLSHLDASRDLVARVDRRRMALRRSLLDSMTSRGPLEALGEVAQTASGGTPRAGTTSYYGGDIPWAVIGDLNDGTITDTEKTITLDGLKASSAKWVEEGSLLVAMYGSIGKLGIAGRRLTTNQAIAAISPDPARLNTRFLYYRLMADRPALLAAGKGGTQSNISQTLLRAWKVPIPSMEEQQSAVAYLDRSLSVVDATRATLQDAGVRSAGLRRSILNTAFAGRLPGTVAAPPVETLQEATA